MIWSSIIGGLLKSAAPKVADYYLQRQQQNFEFKNEERKEKHALRMAGIRVKTAEREAKIRRAEASDARDHEWEMKSLLLHSQGYKDEFVLGVVSIPAILAFTPWSHWVEDGFAVLGVTPLWYQILLTSIYFAVYGIRVYRRQAFEKNVLLGKPE